MLVTNCVKAYQNARNRKRIKNSFKKRKENLLCVYVEQCRTEKVFMPRGNDQAECWGYTAVILSLVSFVYKHCNVKKDWTVVLQDEKGAICTVIQIFSHQ